MTYINARDPRTSTPNLSPDQPLIFNGGCYCKKITYAIHLKNQEEARTLVCHCQDCKKTFGGVFGVTVKVPATAVRITGGEVMVGPLLMNPRRLNVVLLGSGAQVRRRSRIIFVPRVLQ